jgi:hypothetical protein
MNGLMKHVVDVAFRLKAWEEAKAAALRASHFPPPIPAVVGTLLRGLAGCKTALVEGASLWDGIGEKQKRTMVRASVTLAWFAQLGCPIVALDELTARGFALCPPPGDPRGTEWRLGVTANVGAALSERPEGIVVTERRPSRRAARKQGLRADRLPEVEYVIGSDVVLGRRPSKDHEHAAVAGRKLDVRTAVTAHWKHQACGPGYSLRRLQWIAPHWRGPEDAPVSVHATWIPGGTATGPQDRLNK